MYDCLYVILFCDYVSLVLQEDGYDLDMTYITENIIAMGFPAGDMSSGFFGYVEVIVLRSQLINLFSVRSPFFFPPY